MHPPVYPHIVLCAYKVLNFIKKFFILVLLFFVDLFNLKFSFIQRSNETVLHIRLRLLKFCMFC